MASTLCKDSDAPHNIDKNLIVGECDKRCKLEVNYSKSNCKVEYQSDGIKMYYDKPEDNGVPVVFAGNHYDVTYSMLFRGSIHTFNGKYADAELIIHHKSQDARKPLLICIPISVNQKCNKCCTMLDDVVTNTLAQRKESAFEIDCRNYNLKHAVPNREYFYYDGPLPYGKRNGSYDIVVFHTDGKAAMHPKTFDKMKLNMKRAFCMPVEAYERNNLYLSKQPVLMADTYKVITRNTVKTVRNIDTTKSHTEFIPSLFMDSPSEGTLLKYGLGLSAVGLILYGSYYYFSKRSTSTSSNNYGSNSLPVNSNIASNSKY